MRTIPAMLVVLVGAACDSPPGSGQTNTLDASATGSQESQWIWPCGPGGPSNAVCDEIARRYMDAMRDAQTCDPMNPGACSARRPVGVFGPTDAFICNCTEAVNATQAADAILAEFQSQGCAVECCPCPAGPLPGYHPSCVSKGSGDALCR
jgi:hypothetical protein